jgi:hypothetical protein
VWNPLTYKSLQPNRTDLKWRLISQSLSLTLNPGSTQILILCGDADARSSACLEGLCLFFNFLCWKERELCFFRGAAGGEAPNEDALVTTHTCGPRLTKQRSYTPSMCREIPWTCRHIPSSDREARSKKKRLSVRASPTIYILEIVKLIF